jgi:glycyl-tRNA synthetase beta subunit
MTVTDVLQALAAQPADVLEKARKEIDIMGHIKALKEQQNNLKDERKRVSKILRNEEKRRMRLRKRARQLSDGDLVALLKMRSDAKESGPATGEDPDKEAA